MAKITQGSVLPPQIKAWSISTLQQYEECPKKVYFSKIAKIAEPKAEALARGIALHELCEQYLAMKFPSICPTELKLIEPQLAELKKLGAIPEAEFAFRRDWSQCRWFDGDTWLRVKADAVVPPLIDGDGRAILVDFKSGKLKEEHADYDDQLDLYALAAFLAYPTAQIIDTMLIFIDHGITLEGDEPYARTQLDFLKAKWEEKSKALLADTIFAPRPGKACRWCYYAKAKSGHCTY